MVLFHLTLSIILQNHRYDMKEENNTLTEKKNSITDCKQGWLVVHWMHCDIEIIYWKGLMKRNKWIRSIVATAIHKRASISIGNHQCDGIKTRQEANLSTWKTQLYVTLDFFKT